MTEEQIRSIAQMAWQSAANAFRMYPNNKHTFVDHWYASKETYLSSLPAPTQDGTAEEENKAISELYKVASSLLTDRLSEDYDEWKSVSTTVPNLFVMHVIKECSKHNDKNNIRASMIADSIKTLRAYAAPLRGEIERLKKEVDYLSKNIADDVINRAESIENSLLRAELAVANQRIAELEEGLSKKLVCPECKSGEENFTIKGGHVWCQNCDYEFNII